MSFGKTYGSYTTIPTDNLAQQRQQMSINDAMRQYELARQHMNTPSAQEWLRRLEHLERLVNTEQRRLLRDEGLQDTRTIGEEDMADARQTNPVIVTPTGILTFPNFFEKRAVVEGGEERFSGNLIFDEEAQKTDAYKALQKAILEAAKKFFGDKMPKNMNWPLRDAEEKADKYEGYEAGKKFIGAWTKTRPGVIGPDKADVTDKDTVWAGQKARFAVRPFAYNKGGNSGVGLVLDCVQIVKFDCTRIDGKKPAKDVFDDLGGSSDTDDEIPF